MAGRPTKYVEVMIEQAYRLCSSFGADDKKLASFFGVSKPTIKVWKSAYPEFLSSIKKGKDEFDSQIVEKSLLRRALGFKYVEKTSERVVTKDSSGELLNSEMVLTKAVTKYTPAEVTACIFWLKNRQPARWREKSEVALSGLDEVIKAMRGAP